MEALQSQINKMLADLSNPTTKPEEAENICRHLSVAYGLLANKLHKKRLKTPYSIHMPEHAIYEMEMDMENDHFDEFEF